MLKIVAVYDKDGNIIPDDKEYDFAPLREILENVSSRIKNEETE